MSTQARDIEVATASRTEGTTLRAEPTFDVPAALKLRDAIARLPADEQITLDFSRTRDCHDFALAALVHALAAMGRRNVAAHGLSDHQHRLLRYLGTPLN